MGLNVIFYDAAERLALGNATQMPTMEAVLREADIISVHVDGQESNTNLIGRVEFELMKPGALFINLSRGHVVDVDALHAALVSGHLGGAAIDVFPEEPRANGDPFDSPLATLDNVILTPHIGGSTEEAQYDIGRFVAAKIGEYQASGSTDMSVNLPNLTMNIGKRSRYRVRLIHRNVPGVMARVTRSSLPPRRTSTPRSWPLWTRSAMCSPTFRRAWDARHSRSSATCLKRSV